MREISNGFQTHLDSGATTIARCWQVARKDGLKLGFTDHDRDLGFDGLIYKAATGLDASGLQSSMGLAADNAEAVGALSDAAISEADIAAGLFDNADVYQWFVNWRNVADRVMLFRGSLGDITRGPVHFEAELRGLVEQLNKPRGRHYLRQCGAQLGDTSCTVNIDDPAFSIVVAVSKSASKLNIETVTLSSYATGWFNGGRAVWVTGANAGVTSHIRADTASTINRVFGFGAAVPHDINPGDRVKLIAGCDKRMVTCREKFANGINFQGFPHIPREDWVVAYPTRSGGHDGGSIV